MMEVARGLLIFYKNESIDTHTPHTHTHTHTHTHKPYI